ncbi:hypothetical protein [Mesomycoplasma neurolyticum]|uniref:Uncharacterized protein n=1 Tax=Mesomycoplasma neurolyticum TaxID=2120 RepID=A0A449A509_9BACT|nr:hypothetical protein [Mesomycoplasma neurolyticum]VEU59351.1 Uncharacterised protein [Mesomycoplasma neurolyticum]
MEKQEIINKITKIYNYEKNQIENLSLEELKNLLKELEEKQAFINKNPNSFFYIKSLPVPKEVKQIKSTIPGWIIFFVFIFLLLMVFVIFMILAFR